MASSNFDLGTLIVTAVVSAAVSVLVTSWKVGQEEKAKRRVAAREKVREIVGGILLRAVQYRAGFAAGRDPETTGWVQDYIWGSKIMKASSGLGPVRRFLLKRRLRRLVGPVAWDVIIVKPAKDVADGQSSALVHMARATRDGRYGDDQPLGMLDVAFRAARDSDEVQKLIKQLKRLARAW